MTQPVSVCHTPRVESTIGDRIRQARLLRTMSQPALAKQVGCSVDRIKQFEKLTEPPKGSKYFDAVLRQLGLTADGRPGEDVDWDDPPVSLANKVQLVSALARLIYADSPTDEMANVEPFEIRGMALRDRDEAGDSGNPA